MSENAKTEKRRFGDWAEDKACEYLMNNGYCIIERNFSCRFGELDIIAREKMNNEIAFIEVKARKTDEYGLPCEAVNYKKQRKLLKSAEIFLACRNYRYFSYRMDVIEILYLDSGVYIRHLRNAFF